MNTKHDNSLSFWLDHYKVKFKIECARLNLDYEEKLNYYLAIHKENAATRSDKNTTSPKRMDSITGQQNQITAIEIVLNEL